jgi:hypothetical protein
VRNGTPHEFPQEVVRTNQDDRDYNILRGKIRRTGEGSEGRTIERALDPFGPEFQFMRSDTTAVM